MDFNGMDWNSMEFNGIQWNAHWNSTEWNAHALECASGYVGVCGGKCWESVLGNVERKIAIRAAIWKHSSRKRLLHFLHFCIFCIFLHLDGCHKASLFLLKLHALFNGSLDSFSISGRGCTR